MAFDNSCDYLVINRGKRHVLLKARSDAFSTIKTKLIIKSGLDFCTNKGIRTHLYPAIFTGVGPCIKRGTIQLQHVAHPLNRVLGSVVIDKLEADHQ